MNIALLQNDINKARRLLDEIDNLKYTKDFRLEAPSPAKPPVEKKIEKEVLNKMASYVRS
jgi:hypothetical protein